MIVEKPVDLIEALKYVNFRSYDEIENYLLILDEHPAEKSKIAYLGMKQALDLWNIPAFEMFQEKSDTPFLRTGHRLSLLDRIGEDKDPCFVDQQGVEHNLCVTNLEDVYWKSIEKMESQQILFVEFEKLSKTIPNSLEVLNRIVDNKKINWEDADPRSVSSLILFLKNKNEEQVLSLNENERSFRTQNYWNNPEFFDFARKLMRAALDAYGEPENQRERREAIAVKFVSDLLGSSSLYESKFVESSPFYNVKKDFLLGWSSLVCEEAARYTSEKFVYSELSDSVDRQLTAVGALTYDVELLEKCLQIRFENGNKKGIKVDRFMNGSGNVYNTPAGLMLEMNRKINDIPKDEKQPWEELLLKSIEWTAKLGLTAKARQEFENNDLCYENEGLWNHWMKIFENKTLEFELSKSIKPVAAPAAPAAPENSRF